ncbi:hypothetical protein Plhal304r1_c037g0112621 [Plasmopara halstedii]
MGSPPIHKYEYVSQKRVYAPRSCTVQVAPHYLLLNTRGLQCLKVDLCRPRSEQKDSF